MRLAVARVLRPGGRFVTANGNPAEPIVDFPAASDYGFSKRVEGELMEGAPYCLAVPPARWLGPRATNYYLGAETMEKLPLGPLREACWHTAEISPKAGAELGREHWRSSWPTRQRFSHRLRQVGIRQAMSDGRPARAIPGRRPRQSAAWSGESR